MKETNINFISAEGGGLQGPVDREIKGAPKGDRQQAWAHPLLPARAATAAVTTAATAAERHILCGAFSS